jgi:hypothetical protein
VAVYSTILYLCINLSFQELVAFVVGVKSCQSLVGWSVWLDHNLSEPAWLGVCCFILRLKRNGMVGVNW